MTKDELAKIFAEHAAWRADHNHGNQANLSGVDLHEADFSGANFHGANLSGADLSGANFHEADLSGADLSGADLSGADLPAADLHEANLSGVDLHEADLSGADLSGVYDVIPLGQPDGWWGFAYQWEKKIMVRIGCRTKSIAEGRAYWAGKENRREVLAALDYAEAVARLRGWKVEI